MADNASITPGAGTIVATDQVPGTLEHYQKFKIADGTADSTTMVPATATRGLFVDPHEQTTLITATPTVSNGTLYTVGDQLGTLMTLAGAARFTGGGGDLLGITMIVNDSVATTCDLYIFRSTVTVAADNAPAAISDADMANLVGIVTLASTNTPTQALGAQVNKPYYWPYNTAQRGALTYTCSATSLFVAAVITSASTLTTSTDLVFNFIVRPD